MFVRGCALVSIAVVSRTAIWLRWSQLKIHPCYRNGGNGTLGAARLAVIDYYPFEPVSTFVAAFVGGQSVTERPVVIIRVTARRIHISIICPSNHS